MPATHTQTGPWITTTQLAAAAGVSRSTIVRAVQSGHLTPHRTPGGHWRFTYADINNILNKSVSPDDQQ